MDFETNLCVKQTKNQKVLRNTYYSETFQLGEVGTLQCCACITNFHVQLGKDIERDFRFQWVMYQKYLQYVHGYKVAAMKRQ